jgi:hypothetical protein
MRMAFGLVGLVVALAIVAVLAKKQLGSVSAIQVPQPAGEVAPKVDPNASVKEQSQQIQQQYKQAVEGALQQARPMPDDK